MARSSTQTVIEKGSLEDETGVKQKDTSVVVIHIINLMCLRFDKGDSPPINFSDRPYRSEIDQIVWNFTKLILREFALLGSLGSEFYAHLQTSEINGL